MILQQMVSAPDTVHKTAAVDPGIALMVLVFIYLLFELFRLFCVARLQYRYYKAGDKRKVRQMGYHIFYYLRLWGIDTNLGWNTAEVDEAVTARFLMLRQENTGGSVSYWKRHFTETRH